ncbi:MAG: hypothetical protein JRE20_03000 [Deltaproteobacteria bacterium]|nr:hypothetical protein [Deltaproteobacteria bacterium]
MKKMTIMSLVLNLILASLFLALKQVHVNAKKLSEHRLSDPMPDVQMGVDLFTPMFP